MLIPFDELFSRHQIKTSGVLHLGANYGQEAEAYAAQKIGRVVWVEALPDVYAVLQQNIARYPGSVALLACISDKDDDTVVFNVANNEGQSSSLLEFGTHSQEHPSVKFTSHMVMHTTRVDTLLAKHKIEVGEGWFLNIDLQGVELMALQGMGDLLRGFSHAYIEVNDRHLYKGCPLVGDIDAYLSQFGFVGKETKMMKQGWGDKYYTRV